MMLFNQNNDDEIVSGPANRTWTDAIVNSLVG